MPPLGFAASCSEATGLECGSAKFGSQHGFLDRFAGLPSGRFGRWSGLRVGWRSACSSAATPAYDATATATATTAAFADNHHHHGGTDDDHHHVDHDDHDHDDDSTVNDAASVDDDR